MISKTAPVSVERDIFDYIAVWFSAALLFVGIFGVLYARRTLRILETQTKATEIATAHLIASERAWISEKMDFPSVIPRSSQQMSAGILVAVYTFKNVGDKPAMIRNIQSRFHTLDGKLPEAPEYSVLSLIPPREIGANGKLLVPGEDIQVGAMLERGMLSDDEVTQIERGVVPLVTYARITYETLGEKKITQCGYEWGIIRGLALATDRDGFRRGLPAAYNKST